MAIIADIIGIYHADSTFGSVVGIVTRQSLVQDIHSDFTFSDTSLSYTDQNQIQLIFSLTIKPILSLRCGQSGCADHTLDLLNLLDAVQVEGNYVIDSILLIKGLRLL